MSNQDKPNFGQMVEQQLVNMKKRTSQLKGELNDGLTETIAENFKNFYQISQQLTGQIDQRDKTIESLNKELEDVYSAHPELKISKDAATKAAATKKGKK